MEKYLNFTDDQIDGLLFNLSSNEDNKEKKEKCSVCHSTDLIFDTNSSSMVCNDCGGIVRECLDKNPQFEGGDDGGSSSYGCPSNYFFPQSALGTKIKSKGYSKIGLLQRQGQMPYKEKSLMETMDAIQQKCLKYNITQKVVDTAKVLYKKISECKHTKGERKGKNMIMRCLNRRAMIAACIFYACKLEQQPRSPKEIADLYDLEVKHVNRGCRKFLDFVDINSYFNKMKSTQASDFIGRYSDELGLDKEILEQAQQVSENIHKLDIASNHEPPSIAAGSILLVCNHFKIDINKKNVSKIFGISDVTISKTYRKIYPYHKIVMNNEITDYIADKVLSFEKNEDKISLENIILTPEEKIKKPKRTRKNKKKEDNTIKPIVVDL